MESTESLHLVTQLDQLEDATPQVFTVAGRSIGLIRSNGKVHAVRNVCPHKGAPVCRGTFRGTMLPSDPGQIATVLVAFAITDGSPIDTSAGNDRRVPPPATELMAPARNAATNATTWPMDMAGY